MRRMISVIDLRTGAVSARPSYTQTLDLPQDFDRQSSVATLDFRSRARYVSVYGKEVVCQAMPRPLSWRVRGEECLVADGEGSATLDAPSRYTLGTVDPVRA